MLEQALHEFDIRTSLCSRQRSNEQPIGMELLMMFHVGRSIRHSSVCMLRYEHICDAQGDAQCSSAMPAELPEAPPLQAAASIRTVLCCTGPQSHHAALPLIAATVLTEHTLAHTHHSASLCSACTRCCCNTIRQTHSLTSARIVTTNQLSARINCPRYCRYALTNMITTTTVTTMTTGVCG
jgi:hypothetical protein